MDYAEYKHLTFERKPHGVVLITIDRPEGRGAAGHHGGILWRRVGGGPRGTFFLPPRNFIDGREAGRTGPATRAAPADQLLPKAFEVADKLAQGSQMAIRWTKRSLNNWLRMAGPIFDNSMALELLTFMQDDVREGLQAIREKRPPKFPSAQTG